MSLNYKTIFISRSEHDVQALKAFTDANSLRLIARSLIRFDAVPFDVKNPYAVVFFGSPRAVYFFLEDHSIPADVTIACVGERTARALADKGYKASFIGRKDQSVSLAAQEFKSWIENRTVLFPVSDKSLETFSKALPEEQKEVVVIYSTIADTVSVPDADIYVFSSPSNVESYFRMNSLPEGSTTLAWGESTLQHLLKHDPNARAMKSSSEEAVIDFLKDNK